MAALRRALFKHGLDFRKGNAARFKQHQQMIQKIAGLRDQPAFVFLHSRKPGFDCLFAELLGAVSNAFVDE